MKKLSPRLVQMILSGLKTTGNFGDTLQYILEDLTEIEFNAIASFFEFLSDQNLTIGHGNINERYAQFKEFAKSQKFLSQPLAKDIQSSTNHKEKQVMSTASDTKALNRSIRRRYRRVKAELSKLFAGKTLSQALNKGNIEKYSKEVIERHFAVQSKASDKKAAKTGKNTKPAAKAAKPAKKPVAVKATPTKKLNQAEAEAAAE